jgi:hypothetical protein
VEELMREIVEHILEDKEKCKLREHDLPRRERHLPSAHAKGLCDGVEEEDGGPLDGEVGKEDSLGTLPLLLWCGHLVGLQLPLAEVGEGVNDNPRYATTEIDGLVEDERGNAGRNERVPDPQVPCHPLTLEPVELGRVYIRASVELCSSEIAGRANKSGIEI